MEVRELSQVGFLSFIAAGLRRSKKWRDGARGGRYGEATLLSFHLSLCHEMEFRKLESQSMCLQVQNVWHSHTQRQKLLTKKSGESSTSTFPNITIALFLKWYLIQLFHFLSSQKINKNSYRATTGVYLCILRKIVCLHTFGITVWMLENNLLVDAMSSFPWQLSKKRKQMQVIAGWRRPY